ncbi:MAG: tetratricopeptide repeat protein [Candidatus Acidiferrales bacterium]
MITAERTLRFLMREVPAARVRDYLSFARAVNSDIAQTIGIVSTVAGAPAIPESAKTDELHEAGRTALSAGNFQTAVDLFRRTVEKDPQHKWAWNNLGRAHLTLRQFGEAEAAFRKQIELNPYDEYAYNNLGRALMLQQKYDLAAAAFLKQIEVNPLDKWAHANLGQMYREQGKYEEALGPLERAVVITPEAAALHVGLGQVYLKTGKPDLALAEFDKAVELSPTSAIFNDVAYELSLSNTHMDRAQQYAESAVASTSAHLRNVSLARLARADLARVFALAACWDTLGWVHFQRGQLDKAEKYIEASWRLSYHGEVGDHLAQIWERRGNKQKAAQLYAQALAAVRPNPETRARLAALVSDEKEVEDLVKKAVAQNLLQRTVELDRDLKESASAEFFVLLSPGPVVEDVKFISGDERLRSFAVKLRAAKFVAPFPEDTPTKIIRRGTLRCGKEAGCTFVLALPEDVTSVN